MHSEDLEYNSNFKTAILSRLSLYIIGYNIIKWLIKLVKINFYNKLTLLEEM